MTKTLFSILLSRILPAFLGAFGALVAANYPTYHAALCVLS